MKSIVEEASSLAKAFTQAWERAGKPQECTVKVLAEPEKNFIGMTTKSAKLALFFNEPAPAQSKKGTSQPQQRRPQQQEVQQVQPRRTQERQPAARPQAERPRQEVRLENREQRPVEQRARQQQRPVDQHETVTKEVLLHQNSQRENSQREISQRETPQHDAATKPEGSTAPRVRPTWSEEMTQGARAWVQESLQIMGCPDVSFTTSMSRSVLTVTFSKPLIEDLEKERLLFRSWSHLIVQHIKQEFKVHGKELKIILKGSRN